MTNSGKMPYRYMSNFTKENQKDFCWLTRDMANSAYTMYREEEIGGKLRKGATDNPTNSNQ